MQTRKPQERNQTYAVRLPARLAHTALDKVMNEMTPEQFRHITEQLPLSAAVQLEGMADRARRGQMPDPREFRDVQDQTTILAYIQDRADSLSDQSREQERVERKLRHKEREEAQIRMAREASREGFSAATNAALDAALDAYPTMSPEDIRDRQRIAMVAHGWDADKVQADQDNLRKVREEFAGVHHETWEEIVVNVAETEAAEQVKWEAFTANLDREARENRKPKVLKAQDDDDQQVYSPLSPEEELRDLAYGTQLDREAAVRRAVREEAANWVDMAANFGDDLDG